MMRAHGHTISFHITRVLLLLVPVLGSVPAVNAQQAEAWVTEDSVLIGDRFAFTLAVGHDGQREVVFPHHRIPDSLRSQVTFALGDFEILGVRREGSRPWGSGARLDSVIYEATTFALDTARVAGIPVGLVEGSDTLLVAANPVFLVVGSLVPDDAEDIRDITDIADFPRTLWPWVLLIILLVAAAAAWWWWRRHHGDEEDMAARTPPVPPVDTALTRLKSLEDMDLRSLDDVKPYYVELADILRTYFGERAHVPALEATTRELVQRLMTLRADRPVPRDLIERLHTILDEADLVKFADIRPVVERTKDILSQSRAAIEGTEAAYRQEEAEARARAEAEAQRTSGDGQSTREATMEPSDWTPGGNS